MKAFTYTIQDPIGIHARPAGLLARKAAEFSSKITVCKGEKHADTRRLMALMALGIQHGDTIRIEAEGEDEAQAAEAMQAFLQEHQY